MRNFNILIFHALLVLFSIVGFNSATENEEMMCKESERRALLKFKQSLQDEFGILSTWKDDPNNCCKWKGVQCNNQTGYVQKLDIHGSYLSGEINPSITELQHLKYLDLSYLRTSSQIPKYIGYFSNLRYLNLSYSGYYGKIPSQIGNLSQLQHLDLGGNQLIGAIPFQLGNLSLLQSLILSYNYDLRINNQSQGNVEWLSNLSSLRKLDLSGVQNLNDSSHHNLKFLRKLPILEELYLSDCSLSDANMLPLYDSHLNFSSSLTVLDIINNHLTSLGDSSLTVKVSDDWVPPFQLQALYLSSCNLNSRFPNWLQTQNYLIELDLSNVGNLPPIPNWFWGKLQTLNTLDISNNSLTGKIPNLELNLTNYPTTIDLSSNQLEGVIPSFLLQARKLDLSNNKFSDLVPFLCNNSKPNILGILDLSNNELKGELPDCWNNLTFLHYVDLSNNKLSGNIPFSMGALSSMEALILRNNSLSAQLTSSVKNCSDKLALLDLGENMFYGSIPSWIGNNLQQLVILSLRFNNFNGSLPSNLCYLKKLQVLDLSLNSLSEGIPSCVKNFTSMVQNTSSSTSLEGHSYVFNETISGTVGLIYDFDISLMWKGVYHLYKDADELLKIIDLSGNHLTGEIPTEMECLFGLISLNLSRNNLTGEIPSNIGFLKLLDVLDLSRNQLWGTIPSSRAQIDRLAVLDLSNNQLYGKIPIGTQLQTFDASRFEGNSNLCGEPLDRKCPGGEEPARPQVPMTNGGDENSIFLEALYMSMGLEFNISLQCLSINLAKY